MTMASGRFVTPSRVIVAVTAVAWVALALASPWTTLANDHPGSFAVTVSVWGWMLWIAVMIALLVPSPVSLTTVRCCTPIAVVSGLAVVSPPAVFASIVALMLGFSSLFADVMVQGGAYGEEQRFALKTPVPSMLPTVIAWGVLVFSLVGGSLFVGAGRYALGGPLLAVGLVLATRVPRLLHRHSRRWLVIVPAGIVVHDHYVLAETFMSPRSKVEHVVVVNEAGETADFTGGVAGRRLAVSLREADKIVLSPITAKILKTSAALHVKSFSIAPRRIAAARAALTL